MQLWQRQISIYSSSSKLPATLSKKKTYPKSARRCPIVRLQNFNSRPSEMAPMVECDSRRCEEKGPVRKSVLYIQEVLAVNSTWDRLKRINKARASELAFSTSQVTGGCRTSVVTKDSAYRLSSDYPVLARWRGKLVSAGMKNRPKHCG